MKEKRVPHENGGERVWHRTPAGGDYSEFIMFDGNGNTVKDRADAVRCVIRECLADGTLLQETWGIME